ncbi:AbfB domain-containing protein [Ensifer sp. ENS11]|nr:AbfB domain-containing protein [Ensifer sp. ENS11]
MAQASGMPVRSCSSPSYLRRLLSSSPCRSIRRPWSFRRRASRSNGTERFSISRTFCTQPGQAQSSASLQPWSAQALACWQR